MRPETWKGYVDEVIKISMGPAMATSGGSSAGPVPASTPAASTTTAKATSGPSPVPTTSAPRKRPGMQFIPNAQLMKRPANFGGRIMRGQGWRSVPTSELPRPPGLRLDRRTGKMQEGAPGRVRPKGWPRQGVLGARG